MNVLCQLLHMNESLFEGNPLPETLEDVIIFFSTENIGENNVPKHITDLLRYSLNNPHSTIDEKVLLCRRSWLCHEIDFHINKPTGLNENLVFSQKVDSFSNVFSLCIDNFDLYLHMSSRFHDVCRQKIEDVYQTVRDGKINETSEVHVKAFVLDNMSRAHGVF